MVTWTVDATAMIPAMRARLSDGYVSSPGLLTPRCDRFQIHLSVLRTAHSWVNYPTASDAVLRSAHRIPVFELPMLNRMVIGK
ncbi:uncharacterized protein N7500_002968 [Penicillium coprophilum]|uniref:uncharacterized protein n=1 Tax=Penicillium coprophilum TaxID=36646 RepID=UPI002384FA4F|nr:uncharacterized protein N7500_002968 [Penicillium coprophilum]KAJ5170185.1 hypothetical protein N7500_002968 [Penicillium coprophilum]